MAKKILLKWLATTSGYCCQYAYVIANKEKTRKEWAAELGVSESTVQDSRNLVRDSFIQCQKCDGCMQHLLPK